MPPESGDGGLENASPGRFENQQSESGNERIPTSQRQPRSCWKTPVPVTGAHLSLPATCRNQNREGKAVVRGGSRVGRLKCKQSV